MATETATPDDVRLELDTDLDSATISDVIALKAEAIAGVDADMPEAGTYDRKRLEAILTAIHIATTLNRSESDRDVGPTSVTYEEGAIENLRGRARKFGATDELLNIDQTKPTATFDVPSSRGG